MAYVIKANRTKKYLKEINLEDGEIKFTDNPNEAIQYPDSWKPGAELEHLRFNFRNEYPVLDEMTVECEMISSTPDSADTLEIAVPMDAGVFDAAQIDGD